MPESAVQAVAMAEPAAPNGRAERLLAGQTRVLELLAKGENQQTILDILIELIQELAPGALGSILLLDADGRHLHHVAAPSLPEAYCQVIHTVAIGPTAGSCGTAVHRKERVIVADIANDPLWNGYQDLARAHGLGACWSQPIFASNGQVLGTFAIYYRQPRGPSPFELELIQIGAYLAGIVVERTRAEEALRTSEAKWRTWWENAPQLIHTIDRDGKILFINRATAGFRREDVIGSSIYDYVSEETAAFLRGQVRQVFAEAVNLSFEIPAAGPNGTAAWYTCSLGPIVNQGRIVAAILNSTDITEHKRVEEALRQGEARLAALIENLPFNVWVYDTDGRHILQNSASQRQWGRLIGKHLADANLPPEVRAHWEAANSRALAGEVVHEEVERDCDGEKRFYHTITAPIRHEGRIQGVVGVNIDITERKLAEAAVHESEERFRRFAETIDDVFWMFDWNPYRMVYVNSAFEKVWGYSTDQLQNNPWLWVEAIHPEDRQRVQAQFEQWVDNESNTRFVTDYRIVRPDGQVRWIHDRGARIVDVPGRPHRLAGVAEDVTERKEAEEVLRAERGMFIGGPTVTFKWKAQEGWPVEYVSPNVAQVFGYTPEDLMSGRVPYASIVHPDDLIRVAAEVAAYSDAGKATFEQEYRVARADGRYVWLYDFTTIVRNPAGAITHYQGYVLDITERKQAEEALRASEELNRQIIEAVRGGILRIAMDGAIVQANAEAQRILGLSYAELTQRYVASFGGETFWEDGTPCPVEEYPVSKCLKTGQAQPPVTIGVRHSNGEMSWAMYMAVPLVDARTRQVTGAVVTFFDITERRRMEDALRDSEERYRALANHSRVGIWHVTPAGHTIYANPAMCEMLEVEDARKLEETTYHSFFTAESLQSIQRELYKRQVGQASAYEVELVGRRGGRFHVMLSGVPLLDQQGQLHSLMGTFTDITERKRAEEKLEATQALLSAAIAQCPAGVVIADAPDARIRIANPVAFNIRGSTQTPLMDIDVTKHTRNWRLYYPDGVTPYPPEQLPLSRAVLEGVVSENVELVMRHENGEARWVSSNAAPIRNRDNEIVAGIVIFSDITERKRVEEALRQTRDALELRVQERTADLVRANETLKLEIAERKQAEQRAKQFLTELAHVSRLANLGELASGLAHELNQPLAAIVNYVQGCVRRMHSRTGKSEELLEAMEKAAAEAARAGEIIRRMRNFIRKQEYRRSTVDLNEVIREVLLFCETEARQYSVEIHLELATAVPPVLADKIQLQQVVMNLVRNAFEAMANAAAGRRVMTIQTRARPGPQVEVIIRDTGEGLSSEKIQHVFDPFFTTKPNGLGMGLPISQSIIEVHGGRVWAEANAEGGATFRFTIPASREPDA